MKSFEETLETESAAWVREGVITTEQRGTLLQRHPAEKRGAGRFIAVVVTIGGTLLAVGVSLVIKANWVALGDWVKIGGLVALLIGAYGVGARLKFGGSYPKTGDAFLMMGALFFLGGIALVSQIFHLNARPASGVLFWWVGIVALPWLTRAKGVQFVSIVAFLVWLGMEMTTPGSWIEVGRGATGSFGRDSVAIEAIFVLLGLALWAAGLALRGGRWAEFAGMHEKWGIVAMSGALYLLGFARHEWRWMRSGPEVFAVRGGAALVLAAVLATVAGVVAWRHSRGELKALLPWIGAALVPVLGVLLVGPLSDDGWLWSGVAWLSLLALSFAVVKTGLETGREGWVNLGIGFIALNIVTRYFDLFGTMLEGGVFFILTGLLVIVLGFFIERKRRALIATLRKEVRT